MQQKNVGHLKFRYSEIYMWCHISEFNLLEAQQAEESRKGRLNITFRPQIAASLVADFVVWAAESAMVQICWFRVWLFCGFWFEFWMIFRVLLEFIERGSRIMLELGVSITSQIQSGSGVLFLYGLLPILNSVGSWTLVSLMRCHRLSFLGIIRTNKIKKRTSLKDWILTSEKPIWQRIIASALQSYSYATTYTYCS